MMVVYIVLLLFIILLNDRPLKRSVTMSIKFHQTQCFPQFFQKKNYLVSVRTDTECAFSAPVLNGLTLKGNGHAPLFSCGLLDLCTAAFSEGWGYWLCCIYLIAVPGGLTQEEKTASLFISFMTRPHELETRV